MRRSLDLFNQGVRKSMMAGSVASFPNTKTPVVRAVTIEVPKAELNDGYSRLPVHISAERKNLVIAAVTAPALSAAWLYLTEQTIMSSPVASGVLVAGGLFASHSLMEIQRYKLFSRLSILTDPKGPTQSWKSNDEIRRVLAGGNAKLTLDSKGLTVSGIPASESKVSETEEVKFAKIRAKSMVKVKLPELLLAAKSRKLANQVSERWMASATIPFSILNILGVLAKPAGKKKLGPDDYVVLAASIANIADFVSGKTVKEARAQFRAALNECTTPNQVLTQLLTFDVVDEGAMSFLKTWIEGEDEVNVCVSPMGGVSIQRGKPSFFTRITPRPFVDSFPVKINAI